LTAVIWPFSIAFEGGIAYHWFGITWFSFPRTRSSNSVE